MFKAWPKGSFCLHHALRAMHPSFGHLHHDLHHLRRNLMTDEIRPTHWTFGHENGAPVIPHAASG